MHPSWPTIQEFAWIPTPLADPAIHGVHMRSRIILPTAALLALSSVALQAADEGFTDIRLKAGLTSMVFG